MGLNPKWYIMENLNKLDDLGVPPFQETPKGEEHGKMTGISTSEHLDRKSIPN